MENNEIIEKIEILLKERKFYLYLLRFIDKFLWLEQENIKNQEHYLWIKKTIKELS